MSMVRIIPNQIVRPGEPETHQFGGQILDEFAEANLYRALNAAIMLVRGAVGNDVDALLPYDPRVAELTLIYMDDLYTQRGVSAKVSNATRQAVASMELQLVLELRKIRAKGGGTA